MKVPEAPEHKDFLSEDNYRIVMTDKKREATKASRQKRRAEIYVPRNGFNGFTEK